MPELIVDLHIHSHYSRATSKEMNIAALYRWGKIKGINIIGTGDFTHPAWFAELQEKLEPAEPGLFKLKDVYAQEQDALLPQSCQDKLIRFILTVEISNIYKKHDQVRKLHNVVIVPSFQVAATINSALQRIGNLKADGRPILGMDSQDLLKLTVDSHPDSLFIPAHIWTPWFAMFGSKSGFNSIEEAFGEDAKYIYAIETGLSSDPWMNWRIDELQTRTLVSHSDAHSPQKLGREANIINAELDYQDIIGAIKTNDQRFVGTIEFYPEEGKYHYDGHRLCNVRFAPAATKKLNGICPVCGKPLTIGVEYRVDEIANQPAEFRFPTTKTVEYIVPLMEILAQIHHRPVTSQVIKRDYDRIIAEFGDEFSILRTVSASLLKEKQQPQLAQALTNMRQGKVHLDPGYDGVFGVISVLPSNEAQPTDQLALI